MCHAPQAWSRKTSDISEIKRKGTIMQSKLYNVAPYLKAITLYKVVGRQIPEMFLIFTIFHLYKAVSSISGRSHL